MDRREPAGRGRTVAGMKQHSSGADAVGRRRVLSCDAPALPTIQDGHWGAAQMPLSRELFRSSGRLLAVNFQEIVRSVRAGNADVAKRQ
jgi:hypothetical protein